MVALGGRAAEEIILGKDLITSGASNDFKQATKIAKNMITKFGFSHTVGHICI